MSVGQKNLLLGEYFISESARTKINNTPEMCALLNLHYERVYGQWSKLFWDGRWDA